MGPLSAKQHREYLKFEAQEARETAKMEREESRKQELHEIKLMEAAGKADQSLGHKEEVHKYKMGTMGAPLGKSKIKTPNPLAGTELFKRGQHMLPYQAEDAAKARKAAQQNTDTVPAMLTPGEAVIPEPAAQDPKNKPLIRKMVQEGRKANRKKERGYRDGSINIVNSDVIPTRVQQAAGYNEGTIQASVPSLAYEHSDVPGSSFEDGTERVYDFNRGSSASYHYFNGIEEVPDKLPPVQLAMADVKPAVVSDATYVRPEFKIDTRVPVINDPRLLTNPNPVNAPSSEVNKVYIPSSYLLDAQINSESRGVHSTGGKLTQSPKGALGISQVMPTTGVDPGYGVVPLRNNSEAEYKRFQKDYMTAMLKEYDGDETKALAAYNYGPGNVNKLISKYGDKWENSLPKETKNYLYETLSLKDKLQAKDKGVIPTPRDIAIAKQDLATSTNPQVRQKAMDLLKETQTPVPTLASTLQENSPTKPKVVYQDPRLLTNKDPLIGTSNTEVPKIDYNSAVRDNLSTRTDVDEAGNLIVPVPQTVAEANAPIVVPKTMENLEDPIALQEEKNKILADFTRDKEETIKQELEVIDRKPDWVNPEEKKNALVKVIESIYGGPNSMFNSTDLTRFAIIAAGGLLTGGSVAGSFKYAAANVLQSSDQRRALETARAEKLADYQKQRQDTVSDLDRRDAKAAAALKRREDTKLEKDLFDQGHDPIKIKKYLQSGNPSDLGEAIDRHVVSGTGKNITFDDGSGEFKVYPTVTLKSSRGPNKGEKIQAIVITDKNGNKQYVPVNELPQTPIDYDSKVHSAEGQTAAMVAHGAKISENVEGILKSTLGELTNKDKPNIDRSKVPTSGEITDQALSWAKNNSYRVHNQQQVLELKNTIALATREMVDYSKVAKVEARSIEKFLDSSKIKVKSGVTGDAFLTFSNIPMSPDKIINLKVAAEKAVKADLEKQLGKKPTKDEIEKAAYDNISRTYQVFSSNSKIFNRYPNAKEESGFYMYAMREAFK